MFLECYKDQEKWSHYRATTNISRPRFWAEKAESQKWNYNLGHKIETHHFYEKFSAKMFLECFKDQEKWSH